MDARQKLQSDLYCSVIFSPWPYRSFEAENEIVGKTDLVDFTFQSDSDILSPASTCGAARVGVWRAR
jgi:hypothetical protein